jgi:hypothetical protein
MRLTNQGLYSNPAALIELRPVVVSTKSRKPATSKPRKRQPDLLAVPDEASETQPRHSERFDEAAPLQLALF